MTYHAPRNGSSAGGSSQNTRRPQAQAQPQPRPRPRQTVGTSHPAASATRGGASARPRTSAFAAEQSAAAYSRNAYSHNAYKSRAGARSRTSRNFTPVIAVAVAVVAVFGIGTLIFKAVTAPGEAAPQDSAAMEVSQTEDVQAEAAPPTQTYNWAALQPKTSMVVQSITEDADLTYNYSIDEFNFYNGPLHLYRSGQPGGTFREIDNATGNAVGGPVTQNAQSGAFGSYYPDFTDSGKKVVAFTFDDGPSPEWTPAILDILAKNDVKATFFMLGNQAEKYPDTAKMVADAGHQIASHTYDHSADKYLNVCDTQTARWQLKSAQDAIYNATGQRPLVVRPPGGNMDWDNVIACEGYATSFVGWSIGTGDFDKPGVDYICNAVMEPMFSGGIVLMHDGGGDRSQTAEAVARLIPQLKEQGYEFVTVDQIIEMENEKIAAQNAA